MYGNSCPLSEAVSLKEVYQGLWLFDRVGIHCLLHSAASLPNYLSSAIRNTQILVTWFFSFFLLFIQQISTSPSVCFTYVYFFYLSILQHKTIITFQAFSIVLAQVSVMVYPPLCFSFLLSYIWYSLHPAIGILLTLACLIRVRQRKRKTKASPFLLPSTCPLPPSSASSFHSPPSHSSVCRITGRYC